MAQRNHPYYISESTIGGHSAGKGFFSSQNVNSGETIVTIRRPLMASLESERLRDTCANCYAWTEGSSIGSGICVKEGTTVSACAGCKRFRYCSKACQKEAWNRGHKHECKNLKPVADRELPKAVLGCMEILVRRKHGLIDDQTWQLLCHLESHVDDFKENGNYGGIELMAMGTSQFSATQDTFSKDFVAAMYARILSNSMTLVTPTFDPLGILLDGLLCHINHSCDPNTYIVMDGPQMQLRALRDLKKDEELFISYIDPTMPFVRRQSELQQRWFFTCRCSKCRLGPGQQEDAWAIKPEALSSQYKKISDEEIKRNEQAEDETNYTGDSVDERRVAALEAKAFQLYDEEQRQSDPSEAIRIIEEAITFCTESALWPAHRQPLPAFRDDLIVNQLAAANYEAAWFECAKRHRQIIPKLYPQMHHPLRVAQTWQMAMLAQYLASVGAEVALGADLALIAAMLINTVNVIARMSHGAENPFARQAQLKFLEVEEELLGKFGSKDAMNKAIQRQVELLAKMGE
ncbi:SET domain-containing protein [Bimuria novae-zelandiae CBS 107.79]|uniref:SET domain-containing protein n=1 Tax=Bimuria novae-zelandiae CBS 107.79 TaxID=1447943 RepID=A0A6A5UZ99_9PLEO|nr:SET domain-containing protein [Bimuria novae-zelandiae CBS 107.79]